MKTFLSCLLTYLLLGASLTFANTISPSYYDWSATLEVKQSNVLGVTAAVQESSPSTTQAAPPSQYLQFNRYLFGGELTPSSPFYFIKPLQENVQLLFTFDQKAKDEMRMQIAGERLDEMQKLSTSTNTQAITSAANEYHQTMTELSDRMTSLKTEKGTDAVIKQLETETAKHDVILEQVRVQVPDQAENAINTALEASWKSTDTIADLKDRPAVPSDLVSRLQSLKSQGLLTPEEVNKLISAKSRVEAREEVGKYVNEGVVSQSDFLRLDETAKSFYPDEFYKIHETLRFQELQKLEDQKPDDATLNKIQSFAKTYKPGDQVPAELRRYWAPVVKLEEIQNTLRPDLIDANLFKQNGQEAKKFNEIVERFKPRPEDLASINNLIAKNSVEVNNLPPEYQRMYNLAQRYGAQCGTGFNWVPETQSFAGGYCAQNGSDVSNIPRYEDVSRGRSCSGTVTNAKNANGVCSAYPSDCMPPGWTKVDTCVATPSSTGGQRSATTTSFDCPTNAHFVPVSYALNGGYCIPNYTQVSGFDQSTGTSGSTCPASSHRSYAGGPCIPDYNTNTFSNYYPLPPLTTTPGGPYYTSSGRCGPNSNWVPEPINPMGGYCSATQGTSGASGDSTSPSSQSQEATCRAGGGTCVSWVNGACGCERAGSGNTNTPTSPSSASQEATCRAGGGTCVSWVNGACGCERGGSSAGGATPYYGAPNMDSQEAACRAGGGTCKSWNNGACGCEYAGSSSNTSTTPPAGYGSCGSGLYWNGSACQSSESPEDACRRGTGCAWTGSACNCSSTPSTPAPTASQEPTSSPTTSP